MIFPIIIGLGVASYLFYRSYNPEVFNNINWTFQSLLWILLAIVLMAIRDIAYMYRIRLLTDKQLSWRKSFDVIMLWEFGSSVTPSVVGGSALALFIVNREGINFGKTTAIVLTTSLLDELFYVIMVPIVVIIVGANELFLNYSSFGFFNSSFGSFGIFIIGYIFILILISIIIYGIFINPRGLKWLLIKIFKLRYLRRWLISAAKTGDDLIITSREMKGKSIWFWLKAFGSTFISWTARFWVVNVMILAFSPVNDHFLIYARQLVMWVILLISPTPGGSGVAEFIFSDFLGEFIIPGLAPGLALLWRLFSFYPYLFIGAIILPGWLKRVYSKK
ncbi:MAG: flippase-like domain-containing protein [Bacteroidales bacterium]|nr:flippase-like domain-containing protein [Bacteroidales bacterium]